MLENRPASKGTAASVGAKRETCGDTSKDRRRRRGQNVLSIRMPVVELRQIQPSPLAASIRLLRNRPPWSSSQSDNSFVADQGQSRPEPVNGHPQHLASLRDHSPMLLGIFLGFLVWACVSHAAPTVANGNDRNVSRALFQSLEELSRLVDISYCVGSSGIRKPFSCLNRCSDFRRL